MYKEEYLKARKKGQKTYRSHLQKGVWPYLQALDDIASFAQIADEVDLGLCEISLDMIAGTKTVGRKRAFSSDFMPLLEEDSEFAAKWMNLYRSHMEEGIREPVRVTEFMNRYYVSEGNKRVSVLKYVGAVSVSAYVTRMIPKRDDTKENHIYYEFLDFYEISGADFLLFSQEGCYKRLLTALGKETGRKWTVEERQELYSAYLQFREMYVMKNGPKPAREIGDAFLESIEPGRAKIRILVLADHESAYLWDHFEKKKLERFDLILSCGDLDPRYLSFLATFAPCPVLYVRGNHDDCYRETPPEGCICIEDQIYEYRGVRILGLGGSMRYKKGENQYTERQMKLRILRLWWRLRRSRGFDILLTHAPAQGLGDGTDRAHAGFQCFLRLIEKYQPRYFIHGHVHLSYDYRYKRLHRQGETIVVNAYERYVIEV